MEIMKYIILLVLLSGSAIVFAAETIDINTASKEDLMQINGIGEKRAEAIIDYRESNGRFRSLEELVEVRGIGQAVVDKNRDQLSVGDRR